MLQDTYECFRGNLGSVEDNSVKFNLCGVREHCEESDKLDVVIEPDWSQVKFSDAHRLPLFAIFVEFRGRKNHVAQIEKDELLEILGYCYQQRRDLHFFECSEVKMSNRGEEINELHGVVGNFAIKSTESEQLQSLHWTVHHRRKYDVVVNVVQDVDSEQLEARLRCKKIGELLPVVHVQVSQRNLDRLRADER